MKRLDTSFPLLGHRVCDSPGGRLVGFTGTGHVSTEGPASPPASGRVQGRGLASEAQVGIEAWLLPHGALWGK